jgi:hypothetical protein
MDFRRKIDVASVRSNSGQADESDDCSYQSDEVSVGSTASTHFDFTISHVGPI